MAILLLLLLLLYIRLVAYAYEQTNVYEMKIIIKALIYIHLINPSFMIVPTLFFPAYIIYYYDVYVETRQNVIS